MPTNLTTYAGFRTTVLDALDINNADMNLTLVDDMVRIAHKKVERDVRIREVEKAFSGLTISAGVVAVPTDYLETKQMYTTSSGRLIKMQRVETEELYSEYPDRSQDGIPIKFARDGDNFVFGPLPANGVTISGTYYRFWTKLPDTTTSLVDSAAADYNKLYTRFPELYLFASLSEMEPILGRDPRIAIWETKYQQVRSDAQRADTNERFSGSSLAVRVA